MSLRLGALQDALMDPGNAEKAMAAAEELAGYEARLGNIERDLMVLKWMVGTNIALTLIMFGTIIGLAVRLLPLGHP